MSKLLRKLKWTLGIQNRNVNPVEEDIYAELVKLRETNPALYQQVLVEYACGLQGRVARQTIANAALGALVSAVVASGHTLPRGEEGSRITHAVRERLWKDASDAERAQALASAL